MAPLLAVLLCCFVPTAVAVTGYDIYLENVYSYNNTVFYDNTTYFNTTVSKVVENIQILDWFKLL